MHIDEQMFVKIFLQCFVSIQIEWHKIGISCRTIFRCFCYVWASNRSEHNRTLRLDVIIILLYSKFKHSDTSAPSTRNKRRFCPQSQTKHIPMNLVHHSSHEIIHIVSIFFIFFLLHRFLLGLTNSFFECLTLYNTMKY